MSFFRFTPDMNPDPLFRHRKKCADWQMKLKGTTGLDPLRSITLVGAYYDCNDLKLNDRYFFSRAIDRCGEMGIAIAPDFDLTPLNIAYSERQDFLCPELNLPGDLVLTCFVYKPTSCVGALSSRECSNSVYFVSPYWDRLGAWHDAAQRCAAKVVLMAVTAFEIAAEDFVPRIGTPDYFDRNFVGMGRSMGSDMQSLLSKSFATQLRETSKCALVQP